MLHRFIDMRVGITVIYRVSENGESISNFALVMFAFAQMPLGNALIRLISASYRLNSSADWILFLVMSGNQYRKMKIEFKTTSSGMGPVRLYCPG